MVQFAFFPLYSHWRLCTLVLWFSYGSVTVTAITCETCRWKRSFLHQLIYLSINTSSDISLIFHIYSSNFSPEEIAIGWLIESQLECSLRLCIFSHFISLTVAKHCVTQMRRRDWIATDRVLPASCKKGVLDIALL